jgi:hypothetical protein
MNEQEVFDQVVSHLRAQGKQAVSSDGIGCMYRSPDGLKCAVGCLISDEEYLPQWEGVNLAILLNYSDRYNFQNVAGRLQPARQLTIDLQRIHDNYNPISWEDAFKDIANKYRLIYSSDSNSQDR